MIKSFQGLRVTAMLFIFFFHFKVYGQGIGGRIYNKLFSQLPSLKFHQSRFGSKIGLFQGNP